MQELSVMYQQNPDDSWDGYVVKPNNISVKGCDDLRTAQVFIRTLIKEEIEHEYIIKMECTSYYSVNKYVT